MPETERPHHEVELIRQRRSLGNQLRLTTPRFPLSELGYLYEGDEFRIRGRVVSLLRVYLNPLPVYVMSDGAEYTYIELTDLVKRKQCARSKRIGNLVGVTIER